jgi:hypothetical protein
MQLAWYIVEDDMTLREIDYECASNVIDQEELEWYICDWPGCYVNDECMPVIIQGIMGLEGSMV